MLVPSVGARRLWPVLALLMTFALISSLLMVVARPVTGIDEVTTPGEEITSEVPPVEETPPPVVEETTPPVVVEETTPPVVVEETTPPVVVEETTPPVVVEETTPPVEESAPPVEESAPVLEEVPALGGGDTDTAAAETLAVTELTVVEDEVVEPQEHQGCDDEDALENSWHFHFGTPPGHTMGEIATRYNQIEDMPGSLEGLNVTAHFQIRRHGTGATFSRCQDVDVGFHTYSSSGPTFATSYPQANYDQNSAEDLDASPMGQDNQWYSLTATFPQCFYQADLVVGPFLDADRINEHLDGVGNGDDDEGELYSDTDRLVDGDVGGDGCVLNLRKVDEDGDPMSGVIFTLTETDGDVDASETNAEGETAFASLNYGLYELVEDDNECANAGPWDVTVSDEGVITVVGEDGALTPVEGTFVIQNDCRTGSVQLHKFFCNLPEEPGTLFQYLPDIEDEAEPDVSLQVNGHPVPDPDECDQGEVGVFIRRTDDGDGGSVPQGFVWIDEEGTTITRAPGTYELCEQENLREVDINQLGVFVPEDDDETCFEFTIEPDTKNILNIFNIESGGIKVLKFFCPERLQGTNDPNPKFILDEEDDLPFSSQCTVGNADFIVTSPDSDVADGPEFSTGADGIALVWVTHNVDHTLVELSPNEGESDEWEVDQWFSDEDLRQIIVVNFGDAPDEDGTGAIGILKLTDPDDSEATFEFEFEGESIGRLGNLDLHVEADLDADDYTIEELEEVGWEDVQIICIEVDPDLLEEAADAGTAGLEGDADVTIEGASVTVHLGEGEGVLCVFFNTEEDGDTGPGEGTLEIDKISCTSTGEPRTEIHVFAPEEPQDLVQAAACSFADADFTIDGGDLDEPMPLSTGADGIVEVDLPEGDYTIVEDSSGTSGVCMDDVTAAPCEFTIEEGALTAVVVFNFLGDEEAMGQLKVLKFFCDNEAGAGQDQVQFLIEEGEGTPTTCVSPDPGNANFTLDGDAFSPGTDGIALLNVEVGDYTLAEVLPNQGATDDDAISIEEGEITTVVVLNFEDADATAGGTGGPRPGTGGTLPNTRTDDLLTSAPAPLMGLLAVLALAALAGTNLAAVQARRR